MDYNYQENYSNLTDQARCYSRTTANQREAFINLMESNEHIKVKDAA